MSTTCPKNHAWYLNNLSQFVEDYCGYNRLFLIYIVEHAENWFDCPECMSESMSGKISVAELKFLNDIFLRFLRENPKFPCGLSDLAHPFARLNFSLFGKSAYKQLLESEKNPDPEPDIWTMLMHWGGDLLSEEKCFN